jgi:hypothetical protein
VPMKFPPGSHAHVVRRVRLTCGKQSAAETKQNEKAGTGSSASALPGPCSLEWLPSSEVRGLD